MLLGIVIITFVILFICTLCISKVGESFQPMVGSNKCTWGPSYWCANQENAKECNVTWDECQKYITQPPKTNDVN
jgi:saposin